MSWRIWPRKIDWSKFLRSFPKPDEWTGDVRAELTLDDSRQQDAWVECHVALRKHLPEPTIFATEWLVQATATNSPRKWKGFKLPTWYKPHLPFDSDDFPGPGGDGELIPLLSPGGVLDLMECLRLRDPAWIAEDVKAAWTRLVDKGWENEDFKDAAAFLETLREWRVVFEEIESERAGFALDLI